MSSVELSQIMNDYRQGMSIEQLKKKYDLKEKDIKNLNLAIQKELCSNTNKDSEPFPGSTTLVLSDGTKVNAVKITTANQPKGGTVSLYITSDGKRYYQYVDENGKQTKITTSWDYMSATMDNIDVAWNKAKDGHYIDALVILFSGVEEPTGFTTGAAPAAGFAKGTAFLNTIKDCWKYIKQLKNIKTLDKFKSFALNFLRQIGIGKKLNSKSFVGQTRNKKPPYAGSSNAAQITKRYNDTGVLYYDKKIPDGFRDGGRTARYNRWGQAIGAEREVITVDRVADQYLANAIRYVKDSTKGMNEEQKLKFIYRVIQEISGDVYKGLKNSKKLGEAYAGEEVLLGDVFANGAAACRHKTLLFKILSDEVGLNAKMVRGQMGFKDIGGHAWNEVKLSNGKKYVVDTQNGALINLSTKNKTEMNFLKEYIYNNERPYW